MKIILNIFFIANIVIVAGQWCSSSRKVTKTKIQWHTGTKLITKYNVFGFVSRKYVPYKYSTKMVTKIVENIKT